MQATKLAEKRRFRRVIRTCIAVEGPQRPAARSHSYGQRFSATPLAAMGNLSSRKTSKKGRATLRNLKYKLARHFSRRSLGEGDSPAAAGRPCMCICFAGHKLNIYQRASQPPAGYCPSGPFMGAGSAASSGAGSAASSGAGSAASSGADAGVPTASPESGGIVGTNPAGFSFWYSSTDLAFGHPHTVISATTITTTKIPAISILHTSTILSQYQ